MFKSVIIFACLLAATARAAPTDEPDCSKLDEVLDEFGGAQGITTLNPRFKLVTNREEFDKRCVEMADAIKTLRKYNKKCFSGTTQQVFSAILRTRNDMNEANCKGTEQQVQLIIDAVRCVRESALEQVQAAEKKSILLSQVLYDMNIPDDKLRLRRSCCSVLEGKEVFLGAAKDKCSKYGKIYEEYVDSYSKEAMGIVCPPAEKLECSKLEPLKIEGVENKSKFFLSPMLKLIKTLDH